MKNKMMKRIATLVAALTLSVCTLAPVNVKAADEAGIRSFVTRMYDVCLGRTPDEAGLNDWSGRLARGEAEGADIAYGFVFSQEFQNMNLCNEDYVDAMYSAFFGRAADEGGKADWMNALSSGKTRGYVLTGFVNSQEFANLCATYGIASGSGNWSNDNISVNGPCAVCGGVDQAGSNQGSTNGAVTPEMRAFAERLYTCCLERTPAASEVDSWAQELANGATGSEVARGFVFSAEYFQKDQSDVQYVQMLYRTMLGRQGEQDGITDWVLAIRANQSRESAFNGFIASEEFGNLCREAGISTGGSIEDNHTMGRACTDRRVTVPFYYYQDGQLFLTTPITVAEGQTLDMTNSFPTAAERGYRVETRPVVAHEGAVGYVYLIREQ